MASRRTKSIGTKVTDEEYARIQTLAGEQPVSEWVRAALAEARNTEDQSIDNQLGGEIGYELGSEEALKARMMPRPAETKLIGYLESLPEDVLFKLRTLMYVGRGDADDILGLHADLIEDTSDRDHAVSSMFEKSPLPRYLERGLAAAEHASIDLDATWPSPDKPHRVVSEVSSRKPSLPPRVFAEGRHPIGNGGAVFKDIANEWTGDVIVSRQDVAKFFDVLQDRTAGLVILDFIDLASWDRIEGHTFDSQTGDLELYWHDFRALDAQEARSELDATFFPASLYGLLIRVQEIRIVRGHAAAAFLLSGHALDHSEIKKRLATGSDEHKAIRDRFFSSRFLRRVGDQVHVFDVLASPLYTAAILPKEEGIPTSASRALLFDANLQRVRLSLQRAASALRRSEQMISTPSARRRTPFAETGSRR